MGVECYVCISFSDNSSGSSPCVEEVHFYFEFTPVTGSRKYTDITRYQVSVNIIV